MSLLSYVLFSRKHLSHNIANNTQPAPQSSSTTGPVFLGLPCSTASQCQSGSQCYAVNSNLVPTCGGFQAVCTSDSQCATNTCQNGFCSGPVAPTLPLGTACYGSAQCANGASCYAVNSMVYPRCGNFQAGCTSDSQCAFNTCVNGACSGMLPSSSSSASSAASTSPVMPSSSAVASISTSAASSISSPTSATSGGYVTVLKTVTATICPSMSTSMTTPLPAATTISRTSAAAISTKPTTTKTQPAVYTGGASRASMGGAAIGAALSFAFLIAI